MKSEKHIDSIFEQVRRAPTEVGQDRIADWLAAAPTKPGFTKPESKFPLKYLFVMLFSSIFVALLFLFSPNEKTKQPNTQTQHLQEKNIEIVVQQTEEPIVHKAEKDVKIKENEAKKEQDLADSSQAIKPKNKAISIRHTKVPAKKTPQKQTTKPESAPRKGSMVTSPVFNVGDGPLPELSMFQMRHLKRNLYKNLLKDGLIQAKGQLVVVELPSDKIVVNGVEIPTEFYLKYRGITQIAGQGAHRKIELTNAYIKVGDFTDEGFTGSGMGTFTEKMVDGDSPLFENSDKDELFEKDEDEALFGEQENPLFGSLEQEVASRDSVVQLLLKEKTNAFGKKRIFAPSIKASEANVLQRKLYAFLKENELISRTTDFVLIEMNEVQFWMNGMELSAENGQSVASILDEFGVKIKEGRQIRMSPRSLSLGDYRPGLFSGTTVVFPVE